MKKTIRPPTVLPPHDDLDELRERLADAEARIEALETALAAVIRALAYGETTYSLEHLLRRALCGFKTAQRLIDAGETLGIDIDLGAK